MSKNSKYSDLSKNTILFTINSFGSKIILFLLVPLYTYVLSANEYGTADLMTSTAQLLIPLLTLNIQDAVLRFSLDKEKNCKNVISIGVKINAIATMFLAVVILLLKYFNILKVDNEYLLFLFFSFTTGAMQNILQMYSKAINKVNVLVISGILSTVVICLLNLLLLIVFKIGIVGYLISNVIGHLCAVLVMLFGGKLYKDIKFKTDSELTKEMIVFSLPLALNSVAWWVNNASDKYILTFFCGAAINGIYSVSYKIPSILSNFQTIFYNAWSVSAITEFDKDDTDGFIGNTHSLYFCISTVGCSLIMLLNILLAKILYAKEFFEAWHCVPFLLLGVTFNGIALFEGCLFTAVKKTKEVSRTTLIGALVNTIANFCLIPFWGAVGAAIATLIGYLTTWFLRTIFLRKIIKLKVSWKKQIIIICLLAIQLGVASVQSIYSYFVQLIILIFIISMQFTFIKNLFKKLLRKN